jgi:hypothetical protein
MALDALDLDPEEIDPEESTPRTSPSDMKLFAPNGDTHECFGSIGFIPSLSRAPCMDLLLVGANGLPLRKLNRRVVIIDRTDGAILYDPRLSHLLGFPVLDREDTTWLRENPAWPNVLELHDQPVLPLEKRDGLYLDYEREEP